MPCPKLVITMMDLRLPRGHSMGRTGQEASSGGGFFFCINRGARPQLWRHEHLQLGIVPVAADVANETSETSCESARDARDPGQKSIPRRIHA